MSDQPAKAFYRVHHAHSFTTFDTRGFTSQASYSMERCYWVNKERFETHLFWKARPSEPTPYISVFDNLRDAQARANFHLKKGQRDVIIVKIEPRYLNLDSWSIDFADTDVGLPVWCDGDGHTFISTDAIRRHLRVNVSISQASEWFAVENIKMSAVTKIIWVAECEEAEVFAT
jgi:hypothetical protein